ncbi:uncharacterized protein LOC124924409 [Impatiens glandulifera]|uniref:uncharacterized protein LOC124924409 n=1 Tax=Impatiens glandulifera TaxID=253017 RepID=UPI001FB13BE7|nr:uncharacterized protein LOC124924409 [Impatiens glandulifera]
MWFIITEGPLKIEKARSKWTYEDKRKNNLENIAKDILYKILDDNMLNKIITCSTTKYIWEKLTQLCEDNEQTKENRLMAATQQFNNLKMRPRETTTKFDERFNKIITTLSTLGKTYNNRDVAIKVTRALPREWDI